MKNQIERDLKALKKILAQPNLHPAYQAAIEAQKIEAELKLEALNK